MADQSIRDIMDGAMEKIRGMVDANTVVGAPIETPDGVTLIPVSRISYGFASGGNDDSEAGKKSGVWAGSGAAVKVDPIDFLLIRDGAARLVPVQPPAFTTAERIIDMVPDILDRIEGLAGKYAPPKDEKSGAAD